MTETQAKSEGLNFTGIYSFDKDKVKADIANERMKYPKARIVLVNVPGNKLSRGGPKQGYSAYACNKYDAYITISRIGDPNANNKNRLEFLSTEYIKNLSEENLRYNEELSSYEAAKLLLAK